MKEGGKFILDFITTYAKGEVILGEIQTLILTWETDQIQCCAVIFQVHEVEKYGIINSSPKIP